MVQTPLQLDKFYTLTLEENRAQINQIDWGAIGRNPMQMKMRQFFANNNWIDQVHSFGVSDSGMQGGVFFLFKKDANDNTQPEPIAAYVIKFSNAPQQVLFSEYILKTVAIDNGKRIVKLPKSLIIELDWEDFELSETDGIKMVRAIINQIHPTWANDANKLQKYNHASENLDPEHAERPSHLIIMKAFQEVKGGDNPFEENLIDPFATLAPRQDPNPNAYTLENLQDLLYSRMGELKNSGDVYGIAAADLFAEHREDAKLQAVIRHFLRAKFILSHRELVEKMGLVLAIDALLGNGDRYWLFNKKNAFYIHKSYVGHLGKENNPIGVIDNEAFLPTYAPGSLHEKIEQRTTTQTDEDKYLEYLLTNKDILNEEIRSEQLDGAAAACDLRALLELEEVSGTEDRPVTNWDTYFEKYFYHYLVFSDSTFQASQDIFEDSGPLFGEPPNTYPSFPFDINHENWQNVKRWLRTGFLKGVRSIQALDFAECRSVYGKLLAQYGMSIDFDFKAFEVRHAYISLVTDIDPEAGTFTFPGHTAALDQVRPLLTPRFEPLPEMIEALNFGTQRKLFSAEQKNQILDGVVRKLPPETQRAILPVVTGRDRTAYELRVKAVQAALLKYLADLYAQILDGSLSETQALNSIVQMGRNYKERLENVKFYKANYDRLGRPVNVLGNTAVTELGQTAQMPASYTNLTTPQR